jgi:hypothetical protein
MAWAAWRKPRRVGWCQQADAADVGSSASGASRAEGDAIVMGGLCAQLEGFNLQAATRIVANDCEGLERLSGYMSMSPIAPDCLTELADRRLKLRLKRP